MNKSNINELPAGAEADSNTTAQNPSVGQPNANTNVVRSFLLSAQELRIGNWVKGASRNKPCLVSPGIISAIKDGVANYHPIRLTDDILKAAGFELKAEKNDVCYTGWYYRFEKEFSIRIWKEEETNTFRYSINNFNSIWVKSLHQLQNLYFALTGYELQVSLK